MTIRRVPIAEDLVPLRAAAPRTPVMARWPSLFAEAMAVSTALACVGGLTLGTLAAADVLPAERWSVAVQAHGRFQLFGWAGVFLSALLFEFGVRLNQRPPLPAVPRVIALALLGVGAVCSAAGQVLYDSVGWLWPAGTLVTLAGSVAAAALVFRTISSFRGSGFHPWWLRAAGAWIVIGAGGAVIASFRGANGVAELGDSRFVVESMMRGFVTLTVAGVGIRAFAGHLDLQPLSEPRQKAVFAAVQLSLVAWLAGSGAFRLPTEPLLQRAADVGFAATLAVLTAWLGVLGRFRWELRPPRYRLVIPWAWAGLVGYAAVLGVSALAPGWSDRDVYEVGAVRHLFVVGFMAPLMVAMAHVVLARFGTGHLHCGPALAGAFVALQVAWPLRVVPVLVRGLPADLEKVLLTIAGIAAAAGLACLAVAALQTARAVRGMRRRA